MTRRKRMVCLANSRTLAGRCVAGRELADRRQAGGWLRPVSARPGQEVSEYERQYEDGSDPRVLDVVSVPLLEPCPQGWQTENWLLDPERYWRKEGTWSWFDLPALADPVAPLWIDGGHTYQGRNDRLPPEPAGPEAGSLRLIHAPRVELAVFSPGEAFGNRKRRVQGRFSHAGVEYALWVTDPALPVMLPVAFEADGRQSLQALVGRIDLDADRFQGGDAEQRLGIGLPVDDRSADDLAHELDLRNRYVYFQLTAVGELVDALASGRQADSLQCGTRNQTVGRSRVNQEQPLPSPAWIGRVADGHRNVGRSHLSLLTT